MSITEDNLQSVLLANTSSSALPESLLILLVIFNIPTFSMSAGKFSYQ